MKDLTRKRKLYRESPAFRERAIQRATDYHASHAHDADYLRLVQVRKDISRLRGSLTDRLAHAARLERRLLRLVKERDTLTAQRKAKA